MPLGGKLSQPSLPNICIIIHQVNANQTRLEALVTRPPGDF